MAHRNQKTILGKTLVPNEDSLIPIRRVLIRRPWYNLPHSLIFPIQKDQKVSPS